MEKLYYVMVYLGSALMAFNVFLYLRFARHLRKSGSWSKESRVLNIPIVLLILFLAGYLAVGIFGKPDIIMASILFGGSIFVFVMLWLVRNTLDRIQENDRLEAQLSAAEDANRAKTFFLSNMSHDLRTPLNAIIGYTTLAKREEITPEQKLSYVDKIDTAGHQLLDIVNNVLEMSRIESGKLEIAPAPSDLVACIRDAGDLMRVQMDDKKIRFTVTAEAEDPLVLCDRNLLNRVLTNLLSNAAKFTGEGGNVSLSLTEGPRDGDKGRYEIRVKDDGIGMDPAFVDRLFTPFERERTSTASKIQGTGLGMAITKNILDLMGGKPEAPEAAEELRFDGRRVLLAEDNPVNMEIAKMILSQAGFEVETAEDGQIAVDKLIGAGSGYFDLVLMDVQMPVMDGHAAARTIRSLPDPQLRRIPIIAVTANAFAEDVAAAKEAGMDAHVAKPLDVGALMKTIRSVLDRT